MKLVYTVAMTSVLGLLVLALASWLELDAGFALAVFALAYAVDTHYEMRSKKP